jgi:hypothetical protein
MQLSAGAVWMKAVVSATVSTTASGVKSTILEYFALTSSQECPEALTTHAVISSAIAISAILNFKG